MSYIFQQSIGPEEASIYLANLYPGQRKQRNSYITELADIMSRGEFHSDNGQTIVVSRDGMLIDGQHRLRAIEKSGVRLTFNVCVVEDAEHTYLTLDSGTKRKAADFISCKNKTIATALARVAYAVEYCDVNLRSALIGKATPQSGVSRIDTINYANEHIDSIEHISELAVRLKHSIGCGAPSNYAIALYLIGLLGDPSEIDNFVRDCVFGASNITTANYKIAVMRKDRQIGTGRIDKNWLIGITIQAYEAYLNGTDIKIFKNSTSYIEKYSRLLQEWRANCRQEKGVA